jgi:hypothetical protein
VEKIELGQEVKDRITGFTGFAIGHCEYISGCNQTLVQPPMKGKDFVDSRWIDDDRLQVTKTKPISLKVTNPGFDKPAPRR